MKGVLDEIRRHGETQLYYYLKKAKLSIDDLGISYYVDHSGRWNAIGINIKLYVHPNYIEMIDNDSYKSILFQICDSLIQGEVGYNLKTIGFVIDLSIDVDEDIIYDLEKQVKNTSNNILKRILPEDIIEKVMRCQRHIIIFI